MANSPKKVLFLDDDAFIRKIYQDRLEAAGFAVTIASSGTEAVDIARQQPFDAIVVDMVMPDMTGIQVIKDIRAIIQHRNTKIIVFSALGQEKTIAEAKEAGANEFLVKDKILPKDLVEKIKTITES